MALAATPCTLRSLAVTDGTGCSLTRASITGITPSLIEEMANREYGAAMLLMQTQEAVMAGYQENTLEMLLRANIKDIRPHFTKSPMPQTPSVILPYFHKRQRRHVNSNYWTMHSSAASPNAGVGANHPGQRVLTIRNAGGTYSSLLTQVQRYFLPGEFIVVDWANASTKAAYRAQFKIVSVVNADSGGTPQVEVVCDPNVTGATWDGYTSGQKVPWQPDAGLVLNLANSLSKYDSWCHQSGIENPHDLLTFWPQTARETYIYSDAYLEALDALTNGSQTNPYAANFSTYLPLAEQNRLKHKTFMQKVLNSAFYGQAEFSDAQTANTYTQLPTVVDPANPSCVLEYKANALGFLTQLAGCSRVSDIAGAALNVDTMFSIGEDAIRAREATSNNVEVFEWGTDQWTSAIIHDTMLKYFKSRYGVTYEKRMELNQPFTFENQTLLRYNAYDLPEDVGGYRMIVWTNKFFSDKVRAATGTDTKNRARTLWGLDFSDVSCGMGEVMKKQRETNVLDNLYNCTMAANVTHYQHRSMQFCPMIEDPLRHAVIENFSVATCPTVTVQGCAIPGE